MISIAGLTVHPDLHALSQGPLLKGLGLEAETFWAALAKALADFTPRNQALLARRADLQDQIDAYYEAGKDRSPLAQEAFLRDIGYLVDDPAPFTLTTSNIDPEIAEVAGPQLVVPVMNRRFAINAANARWGSLYDALYGTDAIDQSGMLAPAEAYNPKRGQAVIERGRAFLNEAIPLKEGNHRDLKVYDLTLPLADLNQLIGYQGPAEAPTALILKHHGLHIEIQIDPTSPIGAQDIAGVKDILLESALSTIQDCEDSVAAVDGADKALVYANWLDLMQGDLQATLTKNGKQHIRSLAPDRHYQGLDGQAFTLPGRALLLVRNVGHLMTTPAVLTGAGEEVPEGILDAFFTVAAACHDLKRAPADRLNSRTGSIYVVKPKMHGPEEVCFACDLFMRVEEVFGLPQGTIKIGLMDEERRTTLNLPACIETAKDRIFFINTGFLDRTGDEIHTAMAAGPMVRKNEMKAETWLQTYEAWNVQAGLAAGFQGRAQIGKGMWAKPDAMADMMAEKDAHPRAGASCAWVPSPTAATLHALHYHQIDVRAVQANMAAQVSLKRMRQRLLTLPLSTQNISAADIRAEIDNNAQGLLGYVVRWVNQGIGCSKVPDIHAVGLMEDRATLRISAQHLANWLHHGVVNAAEVRAALIRMAQVVDAQNADDPFYVPLGTDPSGSIALQAAFDLVFKGTEQPSGYTEPLLHKARLAYKAHQAE